MKGFTNYMYKRRNYNEMYKVEHKIVTAFAK